MTQLAPKVSTLHILDGLIYVSPCNSNIISKLTGFNTNTFSIARFSRLFLGSCECCTSSYKYTYYYLQNIRCPILRVEQMYNSQHKEKNDRSNKQKILPCKNLFHLLPV